MVKKLSNTRSTEVAAKLWDLNAQASFENGQIKGYDLLRSQEELAESIQDQQVKQEIKSISKDISSSINEVTLSKQPDGVGGLYNKYQEIHLNQNLINFSQRRSGQSINDSIKETSERIQHVYQHENQHAEQNDHQALRLPKDGLLLGGVLLSATELIEGSNMHITGTHSSNGKQLVSNDYLAIYKKFQKALANSGHSINKVLKSLQDRDITHLDDRFTDQFAA